MTINEVLKHIKLVGMDTSPFIYFVEYSDRFHGLCVPFFDAVTNAKIEAITSTITLTEVLVNPLRIGDKLLVNAFRDILLNTENIRSVQITAEIAERAAQLRVDYRLRTPDAVQVATAIESGCDIFLTNDAALRSIAEIRVVLLSELTLETT